MASAHLKSPSTFKNLLFTTRIAFLVFFSYSVLRLHLIISHLLDLVDFIYWLRISVWFLVSPAHNIHNCHYKFQTFATWGYNSASTDSQF